MDPRNISAAWAKKDSKNETEEGKIARQNLQYCEHMFIINTYSWLFHLVLTPADVHCMQRSKFYIL